MNKLQAFWMTHKKQLLIGGGVAAGGLGLYAATRPPADATDPNADPAADPTGATIGGYAAGPGDAYGAAGAYDSTGNDVYDALQPQIEQTQGMLQQLLDALPIPGTKKPGGKKKPPRHRPPRGGKGGGHGGSGGHDGGKKGGKRGGKKKHKNPPPRRPGHHGGPTPPTKPPHRLRTPAPAPRRAPVNTNRAKRRPPPSRKKHR